MTGPLHPTPEGGRTRGGRARMCAVSRQVLPEGELVRFVAAPDGSAVADLKAKLPGRGVWLALDRRTVAEAVRKNVFSRGLKRPVAAPADLPERLAAQLKQAALGRLGLARKAGAALAGFTRAEAAAEGKDIAALIVASDAAEDGRRKIEKALARRGGKRPVPLFRCFGSAELGLAMGRPSVIHAAVLQSPAGKSFVEAAIRFQRYENAGAGPQGILAVEPQDTTNE